MLNITGENFISEVLNCNQTVLVDFWAPWCGQCKQLNPILEQLEKEFKDNVKFVKIDISDSEGFASKYYVSLLPTILLFTSDGVLAKRIVGLSDKVNLIKNIQETIDKKIDELY